MKPRRDGKGAIRDPATRRPGATVEHREAWSPLVGVAGRRQGGIDHGRGRHLRATNVEDRLEQPIEIEGRVHAGCPPATGTRSPAAIAARSSRLAWCSREPTVPFGTPRMSAISSRDNPA